MLLILQICLFLVDFLNVLIPSWRRKKRVLSVYLQTWSVLHHELFVARLSLHSLLSINFTRRRNDRLGRFHCRCHSLKLLSMGILRLCRMITLHFWSISTLVLLIFTNELSVYIRHDELYWIDHFRRSKCCLVLRKLFDCGRRKHSSWLRVAVDSLQRLVFCTLGMTLYHSDLGNIVSWQDGILFVALHHWARRSYILLLIICTYLQWLLLILYRFQALDALLVRIIAIGTHKCIYHVFLRTCLEIFRNFK